MIETVDVSTLGLLTFNDFMLLLFWLFSISFAAYIISHIAVSIVSFIGSVARSYRSSSKYNVDYNLKFNSYKLTPPIKGVKSNHGKRIPFFNKR
jgi:hypothetical protein